MAQLEHIEAIEKRLWSATDTLQANSNYASNESFLRVMGLVFLSHAYSRFLGVKDAIVANVPTPPSKTRPLTKEDFSQKSAILLQCAGWKQMQPYPFPVPSEGVACFQ